MQISSSQIKRLVEYFDGRWDRWIKGLSMKIQLGIFNDDIHMFRNTWIRLQQGQDHQLRSEYISLYVSSALMGDGHDTYYSSTDVIYRTSGLQFDDLFEKHKWALFSVALTHELANMQDSHVAQHISYFYGS